MTAKVLRALLAWMLLKSGHAATPQGCPQKLCDTLHHRISGARLRSNMMPQWIIDSGTFGSCSGNYRTITCVAEHSAVSVNASGYQLSTLAFGVPLSKNENLISSLVNYIGSYVALTYDFIALAQAIGEVAWAKQLSPPPSTARFFSPLVTTGNIIMVFQDTGYVFGYNVVRVPLTLSRRSLTDVQEGVPYASVWLNMTSNDGKRFTNYRPHFDPVVAERRSLLVTSQHPAELPRITQAPPTFQSSAELEPADTASAPFAVVALNQTGDISSRLLFKWVLPLSTASHNCSDSTAAPIVTPEGLLLVACRGHTGLSKSTSASAPSLWAVEGTMLGVELAVTQIVELKGVSCAGCRITDLMLVSQSPYDNITTLAAVSQDLDAGQVYISTVCVFNGKLESKDDPLHLNKLVNSSFVSLDTVPVMAQVESGAHVVVVGINRHRQEQRRTTVLLVDVIARRLAHKVELQSGTVASGQPAFAALGNTSVTVFQTSTGLHGLH